MKKFLIEHIDPLGQGVYKENDQIFFIPKTLPGESGFFEITKKTKGVNFGKVTQITEPSEHRITPECPHFDKCTGCHFLHTDYSQELIFKKNSFLKQVSYINTEGVEAEVIASPKRLGYRNRIQVHFDVTKKLLGFKQAKTNRIIPVPHCKIMNPQLEIEFLKLQETWMSQAKQKRLKRGHIEIYQRGEITEVFWNQDYAQGGFSQVNSAVNEKIKTAIKDVLANCNVSMEQLSVLDLFGGRGNFSNHLNVDYKLSVDLYPDQARNNRFFHLNLFHKDALKEFISHSPVSSFDTIIVDPPRSGFKNLSVWVEQFKPDQILYISCHTATMSRDISPLLAEYKIKQMAMADLFPATYHFEGFIFLEKLR